MPLADSRSQGLQQRGKVPRSASANARRMRSGEGRLGRASLGVAILAGGAAMRLPGKLTMDAGGVPLLVRVFRNAALGVETFVSVAALPDPAIDAELKAPLVLDRRKGLGPLGGLLSTLPHMGTTVVLAIAGDAPFVDRPVILALLEAWDGSCDAVVPAHGDPRRLEPLAALYDRAALLRAGSAELRAGRRSLHGVLARLRVRHLAFESSDVFLNVNTPADYAVLRAHDA